MLIYMDCLFYKEKNQWVVEDDITHKIVHRTSIFNDFDEFEFIRHYRENQKKNQKKKKNLVAKIESTCYNSFIKGKEINHAKG